jgi:hypothetical protein
VSQFVVGKTLSLPTVWVASADESLVSSFCILASHLGF